MRRAKDLGTPTGTPFPPFRDPTLLTRRPNPVCSAMISRCFFVLLALSAPVATARGGDWPHFLGPNHDLHSVETGLIQSFPEGGLKKLWEFPRGEGHAAPVVLGDALVFIHQRDGKEIVQCLDAATGQPRWDHAYPVDIGHSYGVSDAPRSSPVIDSATGLVFTLGNDSDLIAFHLDTGKIAWKKNLTKDFGEAPFFFGRGSCPLVLGKRLIVNVGAAGACVVAFDTATGEVLWKAAHDWNGSYASPVPGKVNGRDRVFVLAGGMTDPPHGGLISVDPETGHIDDAVPWRSKMFASVLAASPVPCGENRVFITEDYGEGGAMIEFDENFKARIAWRTGDLGCQFQTPIYHDGHLYGFGGTAGLLLCYEAEFGAYRFSEPFIRLLVSWDGRELPMTLGKASLVHAGGVFWCQGENGTLLRLDLSPQGGARVLDSFQPFYAPSTWAPPVIANGRLYVNQNAMEPRLICFDVRAAEK